MIAARANKFLLHVAGLAAVGALACAALARCHRKGKTMKRLLAVLLALAFAFAPIAADAACTQAISTSAKGNWLGGLFLKADTYKIAFYADAATYSATTAQYSATNEVSGTGYTAGGYTLDSLAYGTASTTYWMDWADEVAATVTFSAASTCAVIYDDTAANTGCTGTGAPWPCCSGAGAGTCADAVLGVFTFTSVQPSAGTLTVTFPTADASNAIIRIAEDALGWLVPSAYAIETPYRDARVALTGITLDAVAE